MEPEVWEQIKRCSFQTPFYQQSPPVKKETMSRTLFPDLEYQSPIRLIIVRNDPPIFSAEPNELQN